MEKLVKITKHNHMLDRNGYYINYSTVEVRCGKCNHKIHRQNVKGFNFCPYCGEEIDKSEMVSKIEV